MATNAYHLFASRLVMGFVSAGAVIVIPVFVSEIAEDRYHTQFKPRKKIRNCIQTCFFCLNLRIRGTLSSMLILACNAGFLFGFIIAGYASYYVQLKINIMLPVLFLALFNFFPDTPEWLEKRNQKIVSAPIRFHILLSASRFDDKMN